MMGVSDNVYGRVDVVPGCCHVATEFVCMWFVPILPRRSLLFFEASPGEGGLSALPIRFSLKSMIIGYLRIFFLSLLVFGVGIPLNLMYDAKREAMPALGLLAAAMFVMSSFCLFLLWRISFASSGRKQRLSEVEGLPPHIVAKLQLKNRDEIALEELAPRRQSGEASAT